VKGIFTPVRAANASPVDVSNRFQVTRSVKLQEVLGEDLEWKRNLQKKQMVFRGLWTLGGPSQWEATTFLIPKTRYPAATNHSDKRTLERVPSPLNTLHCFRYIFPKTL
jgi:hypothetical protein